MKNNYDDIIHMQRPVSKKHPPMSMQARAAQFAPFAALTGHKDAIDNTAQSMVETVLSEVEKVEIDEI